MTWVIWSWSRSSQRNTPKVSFSHFFSSPFHYFNTDIFFSVMGACFYFLLVVAHGWVAHSCQNHGSDIQSRGWLPKVEAPAILETLNLYLGNAVVKSRLKSPSTRSTLLQLHSQAFFWSVRMNTRTTSVDSMMTVFLDSLPCTINWSFKSKNLVNHVHLTISSIGLQLFCVTLNELLSIISHTFSCKIGTISADTNRWVSSKSSITNFLPKVIFSSRWRRNCFTAGSL